MDKTLGQKYVANLFFGGISADVDPELIEAKAGTVLESHAFGVSRLARNILQLIRGDKSFVTAAPVSTTISFIGGVWLNGYVVTFYRDSVTDLTYIYANGVLIGQHADYPQQFFDIDTNSETTEMFITDNVVCPIVLNLNDMLAEVASEVYFTDYDKKLYEVNKPLQLNQPVFVQLEDLGAGGGLKVGSYAYSMCYSSKSGEDTPWGPITPYIPVPESAVTITGSVKNFFNGIKTWGGETSLTPGRYGIRLRLRIANLSGFDYIKIKRLANNTGQPVSYTPIAEFIILSTDAQGSLIDPVTDPYTVVEFVDSISKNWAILDDSVTQTYSTIKKARTIRYFDRRIGLGGVEYESKLLDDKNVFITEPNVNRIAFPVVKLLDTGVEAGGFGSIYNQVFNKSHRLGERYGYAAKFKDEQENTLFALPLKQGTRPEDDFTNFQFPNRRDVIPAGVKRVDTITLSGTIGTAQILCSTVTRNIIFHISLTQTALDFVALYALDYFAAGVELNAYGESLIFTSTVAGQDFTGATSIGMEATGDLSGTVDPTQANVVPIRQVDMILFTNVNGSAVITVGAVTRTLISDGTDLAGAIAQFIITDGPDYLLFAGTTLSYASTGDGALVLTGPVDGSPIVTTASGTLILIATPVVTSIYPTQYSPRIDRIRLSANIGAADITVNGVLGIAIFHMTNEITASEFVTTYAASYAPNIVLTSSGDELIFTGQSGYIFTGESTVVTHTISDLTGTVSLTQANEYPVRQADIVEMLDQSGYLEITCQGVQMTVNCSGGDLVTVLQGLAADPTYIYDYAAVGVTFQYASIGAGALVFQGPVDGTPITTTTVGDILNDLSTFTSPAYGVAQIDTITLTGAVGNAYIRCHGFTKGLTFVSSFNDTATKFETDYKSLYAAIGIDVVASGPDIIFTALNAGVPFYSATTIVSTNSNMTGEITYTAETAPIQQLDVVTLSGSSGTANITCQGITNSVTFNISLEITAHNFYDNFHTQYDAIGVTVGFTSSGTITFTGPAAGTAIVTTATGSLVDNIYTVYNPVPGTAQIDTVTITGSAGSVEITCGLTRAVSYRTSPTVTASQFVTDWAAMYLALYNVEVTSSGPDVIFRALEPGVPFAIATAITHVTPTLDGDVVYTKANASGGGELIASPSTLEDSTVDSWNAATVDHVYDPVKARRVTRYKADNESNIISATCPDHSDVKPYAVLTPTGRGSKPKNNNYTDIETTSIMNTVEAHDVEVGQYGSYISTIGLQIGGIDTTKLPAGVKSFSIVRTPAAGRVVCQGIGMYALTEQIHSATDPSLVKALNKLWFYSPELDSIIGNKSGVYEDIKNNPGDYQIELVTPCGFFSDFYNSLTDGTDRVLQDFVSMPICGAGSLAKYLFPPDHDQSIGRSDYITFGRWRNTAAQGADIDATLIFNVSSAQDVPHGKVRVPYLELTLDGDIYNYTEVKNETSSTAQSKTFHEPWYIINIIQNKEVPNNNINSYNDIGHSIRIESVVGVSNGEADQIFPLVEERPEDVLGLGETAITYRYIYVDGSPWVDANNIASVAAYLTALESVGYFTPTNGIKCYGIYTYNDAITFPHVLPSSLAPVVPAAGSQIVVKYNNNSPIKVFLGDTYVADASFLAIDAEHNNPSFNNTADVTFRLEAPMPHYDFEFKTTYHQAKVPAAGLGTTHDIIWDDQGTHHVGYIRQWLVHFTCESTVNLPMAYKNFFPNKLYVMRPFGLYPKLETETLLEYFTRIEIYPEYNDDYPNEYLNWNHGGLSTPASVNYDYEKNIPLKSYAEPKSGVNEILSYPKRFHWSTQSIPGYASSKVFVPTNVYDLKNDKASQISILYDQFSERGSNLYVITDKGAGMLLTDKQMITTAEGNSLTIMANDASLIKGEVWLSNSIGCPKEFWRGKSEGSVKLPNNIVAPILVFPSFDDIVMLTNNNFIQISDNNRKQILDSVGYIDIDGDFTTRLHSVIDEGENKLWITIDDYTHAFNFDINNWDGHVYQQNYDKSFNAQYLLGTNRRNRIVHAVNNSVYMGLTVSHTSPQRLGVLGALPYIIFSVTPALGQACDFTDMFISTSFVPYSMTFSTDKQFIDSYTIYSDKIIKYNNGLYYIQGLPRTISGNRLIGKTLFVKISFQDNLQFYDLKFVKTGYKYIIGG